MELEEIYQRIRDKNVFDVLKGVSTDLALQTPDGMKNHKRDNLLNGINGNITLAETWLEVRAEIKGKIEKESFTFSDYEGDHPRYVRNITELIKDSIDYCSIRI